MLYIYILFLLMTSLVSGGMLQAVEVEPGIAKRTLYASQNLVKLTWNTGQNYTEPQWQ